MAIDSENKRRSAICVLPYPDTQIIFRDRCQVTWNYSGLISEFVNIGQWFTGANSSVSWSNPSVSGGSWASGASVSGTWTTPSEVRE